VPRQWSVCSMPLHLWMNRPPNHLRWMAAMKPTHGKHAQVDGEPTDLAAHQGGSANPPTIGGPSHVLLDGVPICHMEWFDLLPNACYVTCFLVGLWIHVQWSFAVGWKHKLIWRLSCTLGTLAWIILKAQTRVSLVMGHPTPPLWVPWSYILCFLKSKAKSTSGTSYW